MDIFYSQNFDFKPLRKKLPGLMADRINKDITIVKRKIEKGIKTSTSPVTGQPFQPITETTKKVRALRRQNRKSKSKPLLGTGKMSKLKRVNAGARTLNKGKLIMGRPYGVYHLTTYTIANNFKVETIGQKRPPTPSGSPTKDRDKKRFFNVKGKTVPARIWFGVPKDYSQNVGFRRLLNKMKVVLKQGKKVRRVKIARLSL